MATDTKKIRMQLEIGGQLVTVTVDFDQQETVRETERSIAELFQAWRKKFTHKSPEEIMAMIAYQYASYYLAMRKRNTHIANLLSETEKDFDKLLSR